MVIQELNNRLIIPLYVQPRASQDKIVGLYAQTAIKITITAPPVEGQANKYLIRYLAKVLNLTRKQLNIEKGEHSRHKKLIVLPPYCKVELAKILLCALETGN